MSLSIFTRGRKNIWYSIVVTGLLKYLDMSWADDLAEPPEATHVGGLRNNGPKLNALLHEFANSIATILLLNVPLGSTGNFSIFTKFFLSQ